MRLKPGVRVGGVRPEIVLAMAVVDEVFGQAGYPLTITSVSEGKHSAKSLHYTGAAFDCRTRDLPAGIVEPLARQARMALGSDFDVVVEADHLHVEFDPKEKTS